MSRGRREQQSRSLAATFSRRRVLVPGEGNDLRTSRGRVEPDGTARWQMPGGVGARLCLDGRVEWSDGAVHIPSELRARWPKTFEGGRLEEVGRVMSSLCAIFAARRPLLLREQAALLDWLAGDRGALARLGDAMASRRLTGTTTVWWAPDTRETGLDQVAEGSFPEVFRPWAAPIDASVHSPVEATGPLYRLHLPEGTPTLWAKAEVGGPEDLLLAGPGAHIVPVQVSAQQATAAGVRDVVTCQVYWQG